ncbi:MAG: signal peptidase II [Micrococcales bacterium]
MAVPAKQLSKWLRFFAPALAIIVLDQAAKQLALATLHPGVTVPFLGPVLGWHLVFNDSAAFSIGFGVTWIFTIISTVATLLLLWYGPRAKTTGWLILAGTLLGGVVGNLIDRLTRAPGFGVGQVVDFIKIPFGFPIFNIADSAICVVGAITVILISRGQKLGGHD